jgi:adenosylmethionine---8-amino-7-oxononanoate aminotransferase
VPAPAWQSLVEDSLSSRTRPTSDGRTVGSWIDADRALVWHPYESLPPHMPALAVESATGVRLRLTDGSELVDGMASWWSAVHGYRHPVLDGAVRNQLERMAHVMFGGLTHEPAVRLAERLVEITPPGLDHVFFADSGSVAVEVALKMCLQAQHGWGRPDRSRLLTVRGGYHGDTFGAMAVCDPVDGMHQLFRTTLPEHVFADMPPPGFEAPLDDAWAAHVDALLERHADELAAVIVEPVVQGAGGMRFYSPACLRLLRELCDRYALLLVFDEIATGFGRTGALFAAEHAGVAPDVMTLGKALTGGYLTLAATLCTTAVADAISDSEPARLTHGPTYMANPLACAAALASTGLLTDGRWRAEVARVEDGLRRGLAAAADLAGVADVRVLGAIGVVQLERPVDIEAATQAAVAEGVWLRPFRDLVYTMPPYVTDDDDLARIVRGVLAAAAAGGEER